MSLRLLSLTDVKSCIDMKQAIEGMESAFMQLAQNEVSLPLRTAIEIGEEQALSLSMPAYLAQDKVLGLKMVSVFPNNIKKGKPAITGFIMLLDAHTGEPRALMDGGHLTALRTGAVAGLATKYFACDTARHVAIIGSGIQAETQLAAVAQVRDIQQVSVWSRQSNHAKTFAKRFENQFSITPYESLPNAIRDADVICTATSSLDPLIFLKEIQPHVHINAVGSHTPSMREIGNDVLNQAVVIVDQRSAALAESGEIISAIHQQLLKEESILELGSWLIGDRKIDKNQLTVFKSVGLAIQDLSVANIVYQNAVSQHKGQRFDLNE